MDRDKLFKGVECCANFLCGECPYGELQHKTYKERCMHQMLEDLNEWIKSTYVPQRAIVKVYDRDLSDIEFYCPKCESFLSFFFNNRKSYCDVCGQPIIYPKGEEIK